VHASVILFFLDFVVVADLHFQDPPGPEVRKSSPRWLKTLLEFLPKLVAALHSNESLYRENCALSGPLVDDELVAQHKTIISHTIEWIVEISQFVFCISLPSLECSCSQFSVIVAALTFARFAKSPRKVPTRFKAASSMRSSR
jgi:hypothetical protein